jgi:intracellular sulfur oxidation DsrE/DsrF family protein
MRWGDLRESLPHKQEGGLLESPPFARRTPLKEKRMTIDNSRRSALVGFGALAVGAAALAAGPSRAAATERIIPPGARKLSELMERLRRAPRRRDFKTVPMILEHPDLWDDEALKEIIAYRGSRKQVWDNTNLAGSWLNLMRNSINAQIFSFGHKDFLAVSATHGTAHLALFDQTMWDKYELAALAGAKFKTNTLAMPKPAPTAFAQSEDPKSVFGPEGDTIPALQERGVVFMACHNAIWEVTAKLIASGKNPDHVSHEAVAAELTNHLIDGVVLTPGIVATIPELQQVGFHYAAL